MAVRGIPSVPPTDPESRSFLEALKENVEALNRKWEAVDTQMQRLVEEIRVIKTLL